MKKRRTTRLNRTKVKATGHALAVGALLSWPITYALVYGLALSSSWVGGGSAPTFVGLFAMAPAALVGIGGLTVIVTGILVKAPGAIAEGVFCLASGLALLAGTGFLVAMLAIT